jgi:hypothetical protein
VEGGEREREVEDLLTAFGEERRRGGGFLEESQFENIDANYF